MGSDSANVNFLQSSPGGRRYFLVISVRPVILSFSSATPIPCQSVEKDEARREGRMSNLQSKPPIFRVSTSPVRLKPCRGCPWDDEDLSSRGGCDQGAVAFQHEMNVMRLGEDSCYANSVTSELFWARLNQPSHLRRMGCEDNRSIRHVRGRKGKLPGRSGHLPSTRRISFTVLKSLTMSD